MSSSDAIQAPTSQQPLSESDGIANRGVQFFSSSRLICYVVKFQFFLV
jgi:hypothetical protein